MTRPPGPGGHDYEYDEAHDAQATSTSETPATHPVHAPPKTDNDPGGDYGYDEAHDFGA
jgi:hypothetical protein